MSIIEIVGLLKLHNNSIKHFTLLYYNYNIILIILHIVI